MKIRALFLLLISISFTVFSQIYPFSYFSVKNGLPNSMVNQTFQDSKGNIWFATQGGLDMFNGIVHKKFNKESGIVGINITSVAEDKNGAIWIGTSEGASKYENGKFTNYTTANGLKSNFITHVMCDSKNQIWLSTNESGIAVFKNGQFRYLDSKKGLSSDIIFSTTESSDKNIWVATRRGGICVLKDDKVVSVYNPDNGFEAKSAYTIFEDSQKNFWIGTNGRGLFKLSNGKFSRIKLAELGADYITGIAEDKHHVIWVATETKGLMMIDRKDTTFIGTNNGLTNLKLWHLMIDDAGYVWASTDGNGVNVLKNLYMLKYPLNSQGIGSLAEYKNQIIALADGIASITENHIVSVSEKYNGTAILTEDQNIWISTIDNGLFKLTTDENGKYKELLHINDSLLMGAFVVKLMKVSDDTYWALTFGRGIISFTKQGIKNEINSASGKLPSDNILCATKLNNGIIWIGTFDAGAFKYDGEKFTSYSKEKGILSQTINAIDFDKNGNIFLGSSDDGIYAITGESTKHYSLKEGLISEQVNALAFDSDNSLWAGTSKGISHLTFYSDLNIKDIQNYNDAQGFNALEVSNNGLLTNKSSIVIASVDGLFLIDKKNLKGRVGMPRIIMDEIKINTEIQKWNERDIIINKKTLLPENLVLSYSQNRLTFDVRSFNYCDVNELLYSFYLEGFDKNPSEYSFNRTADFPNLNSGKYTFHVRAKDLSGNPSNEIVFSFEITPPFYKTWWFLILMILCFSGIIYFYIQYRTRKLTAEKNMLEDKVAQRTSFIEKQKVEIEKQKEIIEDKNREVIESITYARRIQRAMVTSSYYINKHLKDYFILFKPKDIVSGDFYWVYSDPNNKGVVYVVTADCTGHGVPGGFMSMMGINLLKAIIQGRNILNTKDIINTLRSEIIANLNPEGAIEEAKDGMDMVICKFDFENMKLEFSAANNGLYLLRNNELTEYKGEKMPVGKGEEHFTDFLSHTIDLQKGDIIYTFTDGYADQFGGPKGKKFKYKQLEQLLVNNSSLQMTEQKSILDKTIDEWRGEQEQVDDVLVIGVKI